jgi:7-cyano-7-deazaguanine synthase
MGKDTSMNPGIALVVLSGGQDSTTCLYWAKQKFHEVHAITFDYDQRHVLELTAAREIAMMAGIASHEIITLGPVLRGSSPLTDRSAALEQYESFERMSAIIGSRVELTFVPMRNALFLTIAMNRAVVLDAAAVITGVCEEDNANYPDCRGLFLEAMQLMTGTALGALPGDPAGPSAPAILAPLLHKSKRDTVLLARALPGCWEALAFSHTAYDGKFPPTGRDHATVLRAQGFLDAGLPDPLIMRAVNAGLMPLPDTANYDRFREPTGGSPIGAKNPPPHGGGPAI